MRILLDECVNPRLRLAFPGDEVKTVPEMNWRSLTNGCLLKEAAAESDLFHYAASLCRRSVLMGLQIPCEKGQHHLLHPVHDTVRVVAVVYRRILRTPFECRIR
jgi:hypothetical protein